MRDSDRDCSIAIHVHQSNCENNFQANIARFGGDPDNGKIKAMIREEETCLYRIRMHL